MHDPVRELLRHEIDALDVPAAPKGSATRGNGDPDYAPPAFDTPVQGALHPTLPEAYAKGTAWDEEIPSAY